MSKRESIVAEARAWLGTPYHHEGRVKGAGVDCIGLVIGVARELHLSDFDVRGYGSQPAAWGLEKHADKQMRRINIVDRKVGDVLLFRVENEPQHFGIISSIDDNGMLFVHAFEKLKRVVENRLDEFWQRRIVKAYTLPGVED